MAECFDCGATPANIVGDDGNRYCERCWNGVAAPPSTSTTRANYGPGTKKLLEELEKARFTGQLRIYSLKITSLPPLPVGLKELVCWDVTTLTSLPTLPTTLTKLSVQATKITTLPPLPNGLKVLQCQNNPLLTSLPPLPNGLIRLQCANTNLTEIPPLPATLQILDCTGLPLEKLTPFPESIVEFTMTNLAPNPKRNPLYDEVLSRRNARTANNPLLNMRNFNQLIEETHVKVAKLEGAITSDIARRGQDLGNFRVATRDQGLMQLPEEVSTHISRYITGGPAAPTLQHQRSALEREQRVRLQEVRSRKLIRAPGVGGRKRTRRRNTRVSRKQKL